MIAEKRLPTKSNLTARQSACPMMTILFLGIVMRQHEREEFEPPLDPGIERAVFTLRHAGIETFESCEGGLGHAYPEPTIRFHGNAAEGMKALAAAMSDGLPVAELRRTWPIIDGEPTGPWWELTFVTSARRG
jgi:hypothetical protein